MKKDAPSSEETYKQRANALARAMGQRIRRARDDAGLTQSELADEVKRRQASISELENGKMLLDVDTLSRLALALKKPLTYFFPDWIVQVLEPESMTPSEAELLSLAQKLNREEMRMFITQIRAVVERSERQYYEWLEEDYIEEEGRIPINKKKEEN